jgi:hypothetical protein
MKIPTLEELKALYTPLPEQPDPIKQQTDQQRFTHSLWDLAEAKEKL